MKNWTCLVSTKWRKLCVTFLIFTVAAVMLIALCSFFAQKQGKFGFDLFHTNHFTFKSFAVHKVS